MPSLSAWLQRWRAQPREALDPPRPYHAAPCNAHCHGAVHGIECLFAPDVTAAQIRRASCWARDGWRVLEVWRVTGVDVAAWAQQIAADTGRPCDPVNTVPWLVLARQRPPKVQRWWQYWRWRDTRVPRWVAEEKEGML